jgi:hypothetical protein
MDRTEDQTELKDEPLRSRLPVALSVVPVSTYVNTSRNDASGASNPSAMIETDAEE